MKKLACNQHLLRCNGVYYYRRRVPLRLVKEIGKQFVQHSLNTTSSAEAKKLRALRDIEWDARFEAGRLLGHILSTTRRQRTPPADGESRSVSTSSCGGSDDEGHHAGSAFRSCESPADGAERLDTSAGTGLVRVEACGICLSDVHMVDGTFPPPSLEQVTPGHEAAGTIEQVGPSVPLWQAGQRVVLLAGRNCGVCRHCISGNFTDCLNPVVMGQGYDGGWAEYVVVHYSLLTAVPDHVPIEQAALIADAVATPFTGLIDRGRLRLGDVVGLWGIGGLGVHAVQIARLAGAGLIIAVDPLEAARQRALELGADHALDPHTIDVREEVRRLTDGEGLDLAVELSGVNSALDQAESCLGRHGRAVIIGMCMEPIRLKEPSALFGYYNHAVLGHEGYFKRDLERLVRLVASGRLDLSRSVSHVVSLEDVAKGVEQLSKKIDNPIRIVVKPTIRST